MLYISSGPLNGKLHCGQCGMWAVLGKLLSLKYVQISKFWAQVRDPGDSRMQELAE